MDARKKADLERQKESRSRTPENAQIGTKTVDQELPRKIDLNPRRRRIRRSCWEQGPITLNCHGLFLPKAEEKRTKEPREMDNGLPPRRRKSCPRDGCFYTLLFRRKNERKR
ncbi:hypothetical protein ACOSQ4_021711 [Xanthoceras sorbifolium]